jgi:hypothetical protein
MVGVYYYFSKINVFFYKFFLNLLENILKCFKYRHYIIINFQN